MQTFLPYATFKESLSVLDTKRLGKQRVEAFQILNILHHEKTGAWIKEPLKPISGKTVPWSNHPATKMWRGHEGALELYMNLAIFEWKINRNYKNTMPYLNLYEVRALPWWIGDPKFHASHRSNLLRKDPKFYGQYGWSEPHDLPYIWPV